MGRKKKIVEELFVKEYRGGKSPKSFLMTEDTFRKWCKKEWKMKKTLTLPLLDLVIAMNDQHMKEHFNSYGHWCIANKMPKDEVITR